MKKGLELSAAILIATKAHDGQFDRGGRPYILHPLKVMHYLMTDDETLQCIAMLHDSIEDSDVSYQELYAAGISDRAIAAIRCLTKTPGQTYEEYQTAVCSNADAMRVKLCDLRHNTDIRRLKGVTEKDIARIEKYHRFFIRIQIALAAIDAPTDIAELISIK